MNLGGWQTLYYGWLFYATIKMFKLCKSFSVGVTYSVSDVRQAQVSTPAICDYTCASQDS